MINVKSFIIYLDLSILFLQSNIHNETYFATVIIRAEKCKIPQFSPRPFIVHLPYLSLCGSSHITHTRRQTHREADLPNGSNGGYKAWLRKKHSNSKDRRTLPPQLHCPATLADGDEATPPGLLCQKSIC